MPTPLRIWLQDSDLRAPQSLPGAQVVWFGWDWKAFHGELLKAQAAGDLPDIVEIGDTWVSRLKAEGLLLDVTRFATERLNATLLFFPRTLRQCVDLASSRYYALPLLADVRVLFYNEDYVGPHLAAHPTAFQDWRAFEEMCQAVQESLSCAPSADFPGDEEHPRFDQGERYAIAWPLGPDAYHDALP